MQTLNNRSHKQTEEKQLRTLQNILSVHDLWLLIFLSAEVVGALVVYFAESWLDFWQVAYTAVARQVS